MCQRFAALGAQILIALTSLSVIVSCTRVNLDINPSLCYFPNERFVKSLPPAFSQKKEPETDWEKELFLGKKFSYEMDLYRAITCYKRASFLLPPNFEMIKKEISYDIFLSYYLGRRSSDALDVFDSTSLKEITTEFPTIREVLIILYDLYRDLKQEGKKQRLLTVLESFEPETARNLLIHQALTQGQLQTAECLSLKHPSYNEMKPFFDNYKRCKKSPNTARLLNAILPGSGYLYVGQKNSALTSLLLNVIFTAATWQFVEKKLYFPAVISGSLECGWYFGGIQGAGLAAKSYNEGLYQEQARDMMVREKLFPILMLNKGF